MEVAVDVLEQQPPAAPLGVETKQQQAIDEVEIARHGAVEGDDEPTLTVSHEHHVGAWPVGAHHVRADAPNAEK